VDPLDQRSHSRYSASYAPAARDAATAVHVPTSDPISLDDGRLSLDEDGFHEG
jgi:hypothetical protein